MNTKQLDKYLPSRNWLGAIRSIIQRKFIGGSSVIWGSNTSLGTVTCVDLEDIAQDIAEAAIKAAIIWALAISPVKIVPSSMCVVFIAPALISPAKIVPSAI